MSARNEILYEPPFYGRDPVEVAKELDERLSFVFRSVSGAWCATRGCGHHIAAHAEGRCYGQRDGVDDEGHFTSVCRCSGYAERKP